MHELLHLCHYAARDVWVRVISHLWGWVHRLIHYRIEPYQSNPLTPCLLVDPEDDRGICHDFLVEVVRRFGEDESIRDALLDAVEELSRQLATKTMNDNYKPYVLVGFSIYGAVEIGFNDRVRL